MKRISYLVLPLLVLGILFPGSSLIMAAAAPQGAAFTTIDPAVDGGGHCANGNPQVNCNIYDGKEFVWINGGPSANQLRPDGRYFFAVLVPGGQSAANDGTPDNLSDHFDAYTNRTFTVQNGKVSAYSGTHWFDSGSHALGPADGKPPFIRLFPYADTSNPGGVYILAICSLANGYPVDANQCKFDQFKVKAAAATSTPTSTPTATATETATATSTGTATQTATATSTGTATSTATSTGTATSTATATATATSTGTATNTATSTPTGTPMPIGLECPPPTAATAGTDGTVNIVGSPAGTFSVPTGGSTLQTFSGIQTGPVQVVSTNGQPLIASQQSFLGKFSTFDELMGIPSAQLTTDYWFPWYDDKDLITWVIIGNPCNQPAHVTIKIGGAITAPITVAPLTTSTPLFPGVQTGPVEVTSDIPVVVSERSLIGWPNAAQSFSETMGYPANKLTTDYWFSSYNDGPDAITWVLVGNPSSSATAHATIRIAGNPVGTFGIGPSGVIIPIFSGINGGPVEVTSDIPVFTSERSLLGPSTSWTFNEVMGYPANRLSTDYWFPWYDDVKLSSSIVMVNPSTGATAHVTVKIAGAVAGPFSVGPGTTMSQSFTGVQNGPVEVTSDIPIFTSERQFGGSPNPTGSLNELVGLPSNQVSTDAWFPWYDDLTMISQDRISRP